MRFLLIRHGVTEWNICQRLQGREDIPLNEEGLQQAKNCGKALSGISIHTILTSPLCRAVKTAEIVAEYTGGNIIIEDDLIERDYGALAGLTPKSFDIFHPDKNTVGLEPIDVAGARIFRVLSSYIDSSEDTIAVITHGGAINAFFHKISTDPESAHSIRLNNGGISIVGFENEHFLIIKPNIPATEFDINKF